MEGLTNGANTKDWLEATRGMIISAHIEAPAFGLAEYDYVSEILETYSAAWKELANR